MRRALGGDGSAGALAALGLHGVIGNTAMQRAVADGRTPAIQRDGPQLQMPEFGSSLRRPAESSYQLHLDPQIEAEIRAMEAMGQLLAPERVTLGLAQVTLPPIPPGLGVPPGVPPAASTPPSAVPANTTAPPSGPTVPRPGSGGDVWRAIQADPTLGPAIQNLQDQAADRARRDWASLSTGDRVALVSTAVAIGGGAVAGVLSDPDARNWVATTLRGTVYPVPMVPGLGVQLDLGGDSLIVGLHLDVGRLLPAALGFGPGGATSLGTPPSLNPPIPTQRAALAGASTAPDEDFASQLASSGSGAPLAPDVRGHLEQRLDASLASVRVHTDPSAGRLARAVDAVAFTTGQHIYFSPGAYQPDTAGGQKLLVHEAVHTIQQAAGPVEGTDAGSVSVSDPSDRFEREASRMAESAAPPGAAAGTTYLTWSQATAGNQAVGRMLAPLQIQRDDAGTAGQPPSTAALDADFRQAVDHDWAKAAVVLNGFNDADITQRVRDPSLNHDQRMRLFAQAPEWAGRIFAAVKAADLDAAYRGAMQRPDWPQAAVILNGFNDADIDARVQQLDRDAATRLREACPDWDFRVRTPLLVRAFNEASGQNQWEQAALFLNGFSDLDIRRRIRELTPPERVTALAAAAGGYPRILTAIHDVAANRVTFDELATAGSSMKGQQLGPHGVGMYLTNGVELRFSFDRALLAAYPVLTARQTAGSDAVWVRRGNPLTAPWARNTGGAGSGTDDPLPESVTQHDDVIAYFDSPGPNVLSLADRPSRVYVVQNFTGWIEGAPAGGGSLRVLSPRVDWYSVQDLLDERWAEPDAGVASYRPMPGTRCDRGHVGTDPPSQ